MNAQPTYLFGIAEIPDCEIGALIPVRISRTYLAGMSDAELVQLRNAMLFDMSYQQDHAYSNHIAQRLVRVGTEIGRRGLYAVLEPCDRCSTRRLRLQSNKLVGECNCLNDGLTNSLNDTK